MFSGVVHNLQPRTTSLEFTSGNFAMVVLEINIK